MFVFATVFRWGENSADRRRVHLALEIAAVSGLLPPSCGPNFKNFGWINLHKGYQMLTPTQPQSFTNT
jgi:hypothetical protein